MYLTTKANVLTMARKTLLGLAAPSLPDPSLSTPPLAHSTPATLAFLLLLEHTP